MKSRHAPLCRIGFVTFVIVAGWNPFLRADGTDVTAVYSVTANGYQRERGPDGEFKPETYSFAEGGRSEIGLVDKSIDKLGFIAVVREIAGPLRKQNFVPATSIKDAKLLILVFWGTTAGSVGGGYGYGLDGIASATSALSAVGGPPSDPSRERSAGATQELMRRLAAADLGQAMSVNQTMNAIRDQNNRHNAAILGYTEELQKAVGFKAIARNNDVIDELEEDRYFVVLKAYDFQRLRQEKKLYLQWETRFSIRRRSNDFDAVLPTMTLTASKYFGQNSGKLLREDVPVGRVEVGEPTVVGQGK